MAEIKVISEVSGTVWLVEAEAGTVVEEDDPIIILESMKMEIPIDAPAAGTIIKVLVAKGDAVTENQQIALLET